MPFPAGCRGDGHDLPFAGKRGRGRGGRGHGGHFFAGGLLSEAKNYEFRPQQLLMAQRVAGTLEKGGHLVVEAGTGTGKSLAYLVPSVLAAVEGGRKAIVSTHTINLQEQLLYKDLPLVEKLLPVEFDAALLKGRQNCLCTRRLGAAMESRAELFTTAETVELERILDWSRRTKDGSLADLDPQPDPAVWNMVCSEAGICTQRVCGGSGSRCFYQRARRRVDTANVVVLNHSLLFILLGGRNETDEEGAGYLYPNDCLILDEAHTIEGWRQSTSGCASRNTSCVFSSNGCGIRGRKRG